MITQFIATTVIAVMHYYFGVSLLITMPVSYSWILYITTMLVLTSAGMFLTRIKLCPNIELRNSVLLIVEILVFYSLLEVSMGLTQSIHHVIHEMIKGAFEKIMDEDKMDILADVLVFGLALASFFTAVLDSNIVQKAADYFTKFINLLKCKVCPENCSAPKSYRGVSPSTKQTEKFEIRYLNPMCPCHGDANLQTKSRMSQRMKS